MRLPKTPISSVLIAITCSLITESSSDKPGFCTSKNDDCVDPKTFKLKKIIASEPGHSLNITLGDGRPAKLKTISLVPQLFRKQPD